MGRPKRIALGGYIYHVINRSNGRSQIFNTAGDYKAFERTLWQASERFGMRVLSYCIMPNHWHLILWPREDGDLSRFMGWLTLTHTQRWHAHKKSVGTGHLYQGRFKSFVVESNQYFLNVCRYVERNAVRAGLVEHAEDWQWSSLWRRMTGNEESQSLLADWPVACPQDWLSLVNQCDSEAGTERDLVALRSCVNRGRPFGSIEWVEQTADSLALRSTLNPRGRPKKEKVPDTFFEGDAA